MKAWAPGTSTPLTGQAVTEPRLNGRGMPKNVGGHVLKVPQLRTLLLSVSMPTFPGENIFLYKTHLYKTHIYSVF